MGLPKEFNWSEEWEPHQARRAAMLKKYGPQIKALYGPDPWVPAQALLVVALQVSAAWAVRDMDVWQLLVAGYLVGAFANHNLFLAVHELTHNLGFKRPLFNKLMAIIANLPIGVPMATKFQKYHREHHTSQGVHGVDMDIATRAEAEWIHNGWEKLVWTVCQLFFMRCAPLSCAPSPEIWDLVNAAACIAFDLAILKYMGWRSLFYLIAGSFVGGGVHPIAGHFIAEHYTFDPRQETYSYYGPLNAITYNVGFHNEHHDFPNIPGSRLHKLREIAPEYYNHLHCHMSWSKVVYDYITNPNVGPFSRTKRMPETRFAATKAD